MSPDSKQLTAPGGGDGALTAYLSAIRSHPVVVALITLAAVGASVGFLALRSPEYEATANLLVEPLPQEDQTFIGLPLLRDTGDPVRTVQTAAALVESREAADLVAQQLGGELTGEEILEDQIEVGPEGESNILEITATANGAADAADLANGFSRAALEVRSRDLIQATETLIVDLQGRLDATPAEDAVTRADLAARLDQVRSVAERGDPTLLLSQQAVSPDSATGASPALIVALALLAGLTLGSGAALLLELMTRRVRDEEDAVQLYPLPVLTRIPQLSVRSRRAPEGASWFMPDEIAEPFRTLAVQLDQRDRPVGAVLVTSPTSGDGKTTSAINLAVSLAGLGRQVVLLDFDLRKPQIATALRISEGRRLIELVDPNSSLAELLVSPSQAWPLRVLPVAFDPGQAFLAEAVSRRLPRFIAEARSLADCVVVDTPPLGEVSDALRLMPAVDDVLIVMRPGNTRRGHVAVTRELLQRSGEAPEGCVIIGAAERSGRGHQGYGYGYGVGGSPGVTVGRADSGEAEPTDRTAAEQATV